MLDRVARLPGAPCLLDRAIAGNRGEINLENIVLRGEFFLR